MKKRRERKFREKSDEGTDRHEEDPRNSKGRRREAKTRGGRTEKVK